MFSTTDTIVAIATPTGRGGLGVVRVSGACALPVAAGLLALKAPLEPRRATVTRILDTTSADRPRSIDEVVATWFKAPRSYTREDVVEIAAHGSPVVLERIVTLAVQGGARLAEPGEFTLRAYLNGRIDLVQAEAVADLVDAVTPAQARAAMDQLEGTLTGRIKDGMARLFDLVARLEASIDFPDEGFHFVSRDDVLLELTTLDAELTRLRADGAIGRLLREGAMVVLVGRPNVGKSSLFNALVGADRAIVTDIAGTTRDVVTERVDIDGLPITLVDTAGLRLARDIVEAEGIRRTREAVGVAALSLIVVDGSQPLTSEDRELALGPGRRIVVVAKIDLPPAWTHGTEAPELERAVRVSVSDGAGLSALRTAIVRELTGGEVLRDTPAISNARHLALVDRAVEAVSLARASAAAGGSEEMVLADLSDARGALEELTGRTSSEDVLRHIFERFCVGK